MKPKHIVFLMTLLSACGTTPNEKTISIVDDRKNSKADTINVGSHLDKDVEIFRTNFNGSTYSTIIYRNDNGEIKGYQAYYGSLKNYDKATYKWTNDSTVTFKLFESTSDQSESYSMIGSGRTTGLSVPD